jgi:hypothetical protein
LKAGEAEGQRSRGAEEQRRNDNFNPKSKIQNLKSKI